MIALFEEFKYNQVNRRPPIIPASTPIDDIRATKIDQQIPTISIENLSVIEEYVLGRSYFLRMGLSFMHDGTNENVNEHLLKIMGITKRGKVWLRESTPLLLNVNEVTDQSVSEFENRMNQGGVSPIIRMLYVEAEQRADKFEAMKFYRVNRESFCPMEMHPDLRLICDFVQETSWPDHIMALQVSGWQFDQLNEKNEILRMLLSSYEKLELIVSPSSGKVHLIRSFEQLHD